MTFRVLQVYPQMNNAGTERVIMSLYENMDREKVQFDFLLERDGELDQKIIEMGGHIYYIENEGKSKYYEKLLDFFNTHEYAIVHTHTHSAMGTVLKAAKKSGVPCRIAHSHNARNDLPKIMWFLKGLTSVKIETNANYFFACSHNAAKWLFPHRAKDTEIVYNGVNLEKYLFSEYERKEIRGELGFSEDNFVIVHVGRFAKQKNHSFLIDVIKELDGKLSGKVRGLLIGVGPLQDEIESKVADLGLNDKVMFLNSRTDVDKWLSAGDVFLLPSLHEGLGIAVIEAQASGLPCIVSNAVPEEADMRLNLMHTLSLNDAVSLWADTVIDSCTDYNDRSALKNEILSSHYNIRNVAAKMQQFYIEHSVKNKE